MDWEALFPITDTDISVTLNPQQVSLLVGLLFYANDPNFWGDYATHSDTIDAVISSTLATIQLG